MNNNSLEEQVKEAIERCKGGKCEGCPFNGVSTCCVTVLLHIQHTTATFEKDGHHLRCSNCGAKMELMKEQETVKPINMENDVVYGLSEISLYLSNTGKDDFAQTIEDACKKLELQEKRINELEERLRLLEYGDQDILHSGMMPAT